MWILQQELQVFFLSSRSQLYITTMTVHTNLGLKSICVKLRLNPIFLCKCVMVMVIKLSIIIKGKKFVWETAAIDYILSVLSMCLSLWYLNLFLLSGHFITVEYLKYYPHLHSSVQVWVYWSVMRSLTMLWLVYGSRRIAILIFVITRYTMGGMVASVYSMAVEVRIIQSINVRFPVYEIEPKLKSSTSTLQICKLLVEEEFLECKSW